MRRSLEVAEEENVRNLIKIEVIKPQKELKYKSKYADKVKRDNRVVKHGHKTMGYAQVPLNPPDQYLKKHTRPMMKAQVDHHCLGRHSPRRTFPGARDTEEEKRNKENLLQHAMRDFVKANVEEIGQLQPQERRQKLVIQDSVRGHTDVCMMPHYVWSKNFGKTPVYITKRKQLYERYLKEQQTLGQGDETLPYHQISEEERFEILQGLKNYWAETQLEFQSLPLKIDTEPLKKRKSTLEAKLQSLEKDIDLMERHDSIYVMPNGCS